MANPCLPRSRAVGGQVPGGPARVGADELPEQEHLDYLVRRDGLIHVGEVPGPRRDTAEGHPGVRQLHAVQRGEHRVRDKTTNARHFTLYSLRHATGKANSQLASDLPPKIKMMNPMYFLAHKNPSRARHWSIRTGTLDNNTSHTIAGNLAAITTSLGDNVNSALDWDGGHAVNQDAPEFHRLGRQDHTGYSEA